MTIHYMESPVSDCVICDRRSPMFRFLTDEELKLIRANKQTVRFIKGETIRKQSTGMSHVISLNSGMAKLYLEGIGEKNAILRIVKSINFIGGPGIYLDQLHHFTVTALTDAIVCFIEVNTFKEIVAGNRRFAEEFMKDFSQTIVSVYNRLILLTQKGMHGRMADALIYLMDEVFEETSFERLLSIQDMADLSAISKDSTYKILRQFETDKLIRTQDHRLEILDPTALRVISKNG